MEKNTSITPNKKQNCSSTQSSNLLFGCITLFVICAILIALGLFLIIAIKTYFGGILLIFLSIVFIVINCILNKHILFKKKSKEFNQEQN